MRSSVILAFATLSSCAAAVLHRHNSTFKPDYVLVATAKNITVDCQSRYSVVINGTSPGPPLTLQEGRTTWVRVYNNIQGQNLTVHWHGLSQRTAPFSDGTPLVSQWPIPSMNYFDYEVRPDLGDAGSYFYHSHVGFQSISAHGALIVKECGTPPYKYDRDIPLLLGDFYKKNDSTISAGLLANPFVWSGETNALLVNGQSGHSGFNNATDKTCAPHIIRVQPGKTYRLRFIGGTAISLITLGIEGHDNLTIIEADGAYTRPYNVSHLQVGSGQRFSVLFRAKTAAELQKANKTTFWIPFENRERPANVSGYAILAYDTGNSSSALNNTLKSLALPAKSPVTLPQKIYDWLEYSLQPLNTTRYNFPTASTRTVTINMHQVGTTNSSGAFTSTLQWEQNGDIWQETARESTMPYLVDIYKRGQAAIPDLQVALKNGGWDPYSLLYPAKIGEVIDIVWESSNLPTGGWDIHPMHAHGGHYWDLGSGNGTYNATANAAKLKGFTPARRDTTMLYRYATSGVKGTTAGWRAWRLNVTDAGVWMLHCHILQHMIMGMQTVWVMGDAKDITAAWPQPYVAGYLDFGGSAYGNATYDPLVNHYFATNRYDTCK